MGTVNLTGIGRVLVRRGTPVLLRVCVAALVALDAPRARAQFDNTWLTFVQETDRLRAPDGSLATYVSNDGREKDMAWGDLDRDGWTDLVIVMVTTPPGQLPNFLLMNEYGNLVERTADYGLDSDLPGDLGLLARTSNRDVVLCDVDLDGWLDVVTSTSSLTGGEPKHISHPRVYRNKGRDASGHWLGLRYEDNRIPLLFPQPTYQNINGVAAGDVTGDGYPDLYLCGGDRLLVNDGTGHFVNSGTTRMTAQMLLDNVSSTARIVDMNGDGAPDIVRNTGYGAFPSQVVSIAYNDPTNIGFFPQANYQGDVGGGFVNYVDVGDLNNDGHPDLAVASDTGNGCRYQSGIDAQGLATWSPKLLHTYAADGQVAFDGSNLIVDLDGDGWNDLLQNSIDITALEYTDRAHILHNIGSVLGGQQALREEAGLVTGPWRGAVGIQASDLIAMWDFAAFDIDNDGDVDMVFSRASATTVWMNQWTSPPVVTTYCSGDGSSTACPCGNVGAAGNGCANSQNVSGGRLSAVGVARVSNDSWHLHASGVTNSPGLYFQGVAQAGGGLGVVFGDGLRCVGRHGRAPRCRGGRRERFHVSERRASQHADLDPGRRGGGRHAPLSAVVPRFERRVLHGLRVQPDQRSVGHVGSLTSLHAMTLAR